MGDLNQRALRLCGPLPNLLDDYRLASRSAASGTKLHDFGVDVRGTVEAGELLARVCLADLADVALIDPDPEVGDWPQISVTTDQPIAACMLSQYAGWEINDHDYFAMGSGPMRAGSAREPLYRELGYQETAASCVGVLESACLPPDEVCVDIAKKCGIHPAELTLLVAPTASMAGTLQVVARSVESVLHKLHELDFDLSRVVQGRGTAPLPPVAPDDLTAVGATNDAILYGGRVQLQVLGDDRSLQDIGPRVPSCASSAYGDPFAKLLARHDNDFYRIDPLLFSAAEVTLINVNTGNQFQFGHVNAPVLEQSLGGL